MRNITSYSAGHLLAKEKRRKKRSREFAKRPRGLWSGFYEVRSYLTECDEVAILFFCPEKDTDDNPFGLNCSYALSSKKNKPFEQYVSSIMMMYRLPRPDT